MTTIGESIARVRNIIKGSKQDAFLTDRFIYSVIVKYAKMFIKRKDELNVRLKFYSLYKKINGVELQEIENTEGSLIPSGCKMMRTVNKIPAPFEGAFGPFIRTVSSIDGSEEIYRTSPAAFASMSKTSAFKYNKSKYYWYMDGYLYFPNLDWKAVAVEGIFQEDISVFTHNEDGECRIRQNDPFLIPDDLFAEIEKQVLADFGFSMQVPNDTAVSDKQNILR